MGTSLALPDDVPAHAGQGRRTRGHRRLFVVGEVVETHEAPSTEGASLG